MYSVEALPEVVDQLDALPRDAQLDYAELIGFLQMTPDNGSPYNTQLADGRMRTQHFGAEQRGLATYLVLPDEYRVVVLNVVWL